jgi:hypothetical protein
MKAIVVAALLAVAGCGNDSRPVPADTTKALSADSREWTRSLVGSADTAFVVRFANPEPDATYSLSVTVADHTESADAGALTICFTDQWDFGYAISACHTPGIVNNAEQWVQYKITASGLRNGG